LLSGKLYEPRAVQHQLEPALQKIGGPARDDHPGEKYLKVFHHLSDAGVDNQVEDNPPFLLVNSQC